MRQLLREIDARELAEWEAFYMLAPFGPVADDIRSATIAATVYNSLRGKKHKALTPRDFAIGKLAGGKLSDSGGSDDLADKLVAMFQGMAAEQKTE